jgi:hypothetical protein
MKNRYGVSGEVLADLRRRDQHCVYCGVFMSDKRDPANMLTLATIEHLYPPGNDSRWISWCCRACNSSHRKPLREWFRSAYCIQRGINENTVAPIIKEFLASGLKESDQLWLDGREDRFLKAAPWGEPAEDGRQSIVRDELPANSRKAFDRVVIAIAKRRYSFDFRGMAPGTFGRYYGFMYWAEGDRLNRVLFPD